MNTNYCISFGGNFLGKGLQQPGRRRISPAVLRQRSRRTLQVLFRPQWTQKWTYSKLLKILPNLMGWSACQLQRRVHYTKVNSTTQMTLCCFPIWDLSRVLVQKVSTGKLGIPKIKPRLKAVEWLRLLGEYRMSREFPLILWFQQPRRLAVHARVGTRALLIL